LYHTTTRYVLRAEPTAPTSRRSGHSGLGVRNAVISHGPVPLSFLTFPSSCRDRACPAPCLSPPPRPRHFISPSTAHRALIQPSMPATPPHQRGRCGAARAVPTASKDDGQSTRSRPPPQATACEVIASSPSPSSQSTTTTTRSRVRPDGVQR
jgi:hypothetical protein